MKIAIMQPYFFPYIGYFQLINSVDKFIFYDDVNYIKRGWINRNKILINNNSSYITVSLKKASQNKLINELVILDNRPKLKNSIQMAYKKAPFFKHVWPIINKCLECNISMMSELSILSIKEICNYLEINTQFEVSSEKYEDTKNLKKENRIKAICKMINTDYYINQIGGQELYNKNDFSESGINLLFLSPIITEYKQFSNSFIPNLSIIDILMFNSAEKVREMLDNYKLL